jgi:hypothetical protein
VPAENAANRRKEIRYQTVLDNEADLTKRQRPVDELTVVKIGHEYDLCG